MESRHEKDYRVRMCEMNNRGWVFALLLIVSVQSLSEVSENQIFALCKKELEFDYNGLFVTNVYSSVELAINTKTLKNRTDIVLREALQHALEHLEAAASKDDSRQYTQATKSIQSLLDNLFYESVSNKCAFARLDASIERLEYSLVRILEIHRSSLLNDEQIVALIPDSYSSANRATYSKGMRVMKFRDMIRIGVAIEDYRRRMGRLPVSLGELELAEDITNNMVRGMKFYYQCENGIWMLRYSGSSCPVEFNVYIPELDVGKISRWPYSECLFLSSDFALKRQQLFSGMVINVNNKM